MKNLDLLPLSPEVKKRLDEFARQYARCLLYTSDAADE